MKKKKNKTGRLRIWLRRIAAVMLGIIMLGIIAAVIAAPRAERYILKRLNTAFANAPGKALTVESVRSSFLGVYLTNVRYEDETKGVSFQSNLVRIGPWWRLLFGIAGEVEGGLVVVDDIEQALAPTEAVEWKNWMMNFGSLSMEIGIRGERMVLGGTSGRVAFGKAGLLKTEVSIDRVNGEYAGLYAAYDSSGMNRLSLEIDPAILRRLLPEGVSLSGQIRFTGNLSIVPLRGRGRLDVGEISLLLWDTRGKNIGGSIETEISGESMSVQAKLLSGELSTTLVEYDFSNHPVTLYAKVTRALASVSRENNTYHVEGSFMVSEVAKARLPVENGQEGPERRGREGSTPSPGATPSQLRGVSLPGTPGSVTWKGTVEKQPEAPSRIDMAIFVNSFPISPLIRSKKVDVTSDGVVSRNYQLSGPWPKLEVKAETSIKDLSITWPGLNLAIEGIEAGSLEGQWQTQ